MCSVTLLLIPSHALSHTQQREGESTTEADNHSTDLRHGGALRAEEHEAEQDRDDLIHVAGERDGRCRGALVAARVALARQRTNRCERMSPVLSRVALAGEKLASCIHCHNCSLDPSPQCTGMSQVSIKRYMTVTQASLKTSHQA